MQDPEQSSLPKVGRYHLVERLAVGGMAEVFLACQRGDHALDRLVVIKRILPHLAQNPEFVEAFAREAQIAARINHPNVVQIHELGEAGGLPFIAMEYVSGSTVKQLVVAARHAAVRLPIDAALHLVLQACAGAHVAHELLDAHGKPFGLVHRDISPHNLMVDEQAHVKLLDFGIAKAQEGMDQTRTGLLKGKISYMSPEQCRQDRLDRRSDVFALGVVAYELLAGQKPFGAASELATMQNIVNGTYLPLRELRPELSPGIAAAIDKAMAIRREDRWDSADVFRRELKREAHEAGVDIDPDRAALLVSTLLGERHEARKRAVDQALERTLVSMAGVPPGDGVLTDRSLGTGPNDVTGVSAASVASPTRSATTSAGVSVASGVVASLGALVGMAGVVVAVVVVGVAAWWVSAPAGPPGEPAPVDPFPPVELVGEPVVVSVAPVMDPVELAKNHDPIRRYLERRLARPVKFDIAPSYEAAAAAVVEGREPFAFLPHNTVLLAAASEPGLRVLAVKVVDGSASTDGYLLVRRDTPATTIGELVGHGLCLSDPLSSTGYKLPRAYIGRAGLDPDADFETRLSGNHQTVLVDLLEGRCDVGATYSGNFNTADQRGVATARLRILAMTGSSPHDAFVAGRSADPALADAVRDALIAFDPARDAGTDRVGESELITGFEPATDAYLHPPAP